MSFLSALSFGNPIALWGLLSIPGIWLLLKIYPPAPKTIFFRAIKFLTNINNDEETAGNTPLWLLLFRILLVIILTIYHVFLFQCLKKFAANENSHSPGFYRIINEIPTILLIAIILSALSQADLNFLSKIFLSTFVKSFGYLK